MNRHYLARPGTVRHALMKEMDDLKKAEVPRNAVIPLFSEPYSKLLGELGQDRLDIFYGWRVKEKLIEKPPLPSAS